MAKLHTHLHLGCLLKEKVFIEDFDSFILGNAYPDSKEHGLELHYKKDWNEACDLDAFLEKETMDSFTLGYYFHLWVDNHIEQFDLQDITASDCLICDMEVLHPVLAYLSESDYEGKEKEAMDNIHTLDCIPMPLYLVFDGKKKSYRKLLMQVVDRFIEENEHLLIVIFRKMRRFNQKLSNEETLEILKRNTSGTLACFDENGYPYAVPLSYVYDDDKIYFHSAKSGHKIDAIRFYPKASFCVIDQDQIVPEKYTTFFRSVIAFGRVHIITDEALKREAITKLAKKYSYDYQEGIEEEIKQAQEALCMLQFDIEQMSGKEAIELVKQKTSQ